MVTAICYKVNRSVMLTHFSQRYDMFVVIIVYSCICHSFKTFKNLVVLGILLELSIT